MTPTSTASLTSQRAALHMRGGASCPSVARTQRAGPNAITCPSAAPPPLRCGRGPQQHAMFAPNVPKRKARARAVKLHQQHWISPGTMLRPRGLRPGACPRVDGFLPVPPPPKQVPRRAPVGAARHCPPTAPARARAQVAGPTARDPCRAGRKLTRRCCAARPAHTDSPAVAPEAAGTISIA